MVSNLFSDMTRVLMEFFYDTIFTTVIYSCMDMRMGRDEKSMHEIDEWARYSFLSHTLHPLHGG